MINTEHNGNGVGVGNGGTAAAPAQEKQHAGGTKKTALRDVQNEKVGSVLKQHESLLPGGGRSSGDTIKVCGTKRLTPERPSSSKGLPSLTFSGTNENVMNARRRFELELGRGRLHNNVEKISSYSEAKNMGPMHQEIAHKINQLRDSNIPNVPVATSNNLTATMALSSSGPSIPGSFGKPRNTTPVAKVPSEFPRTADSKSTKDQQIRAERYVSLQNYLKQCDETDHRDYIQMLLHSSATELSRRAVELEKRAIQLTIEEGNEIQRMKAMNILAKSSAAMDSVTTTKQATR